MAGDAWVMDIIWHTLIIATKWVYNFWTEWSMELLLGASFMAQLVLSLYAGSRWRGASKALRYVIWLFYLGADYVATTALGQLSISGMSSERQLVAFWAPFFLLHLGGPDNITAYEVEDNQLSTRSVLLLLMRVLGVLIVVYNSVSESWTLILAAWSMLLVCVTKYVERTLALYRANMGTIRRSLKLNGHHGGPHRNLTFAAGDDTALLMRAHSLFLICKHAMVESWVEEELDEAEAAQTRKEFFDLKWYQLFHVMEMELSLMYDFLYTKASVIYTWHGYAIRVLSPFAAVGAYVLVEMSNQGGRHKLSDVVITRVLLVATFITEMVSLLRALGSSWTGFLICTKLPPVWIRHQLFCNSRWHRFRHALASVGLLGTIAKESHYKVADDEEEYRVNNHRRWSGKIGQFNLFQRVTSGPLQKEHESFWAGSEDTIDPGVRKVVYRKVRHKVRDFRIELKSTVASEKKVNLAAELRTKMGQNTLETYGLHHELGKSLENELQVGILTWHIGTDIFLNISGKAKASDQVASGEGNAETQQVKAIRTLSNYMMYLLSERPHMLPGLVTRRLLEQTRENLVEIWNKKTEDAGETASARQEQLARILHRGNFDSEQINTYLDEGIELGKILIEKKNMVFSKENEKEKKKGIVEVILEVWVDMLFYASYRCSKESHAKQLAYGGELTTMVWLLAEHAGLFVVPKHTKKQGNQNSGEGEDGSTQTGPQLNSRQPDDGKIQTSQRDTYQPATHHQRTSSWNGGGEVMIQLHPLGFSSGAYDLQTHDCFHQNFL